MFKSLARKTYSLVRRSLIWIMQANYHTVPEMLEMIEGHNNSVCKKIYNDNLKLFKVVPGSSHNHQAWAGGYLDHVQEIMNIAIVIYELLNTLRPLPFTLSELLTVVYLHDIEKPWKYDLDANGKIVYKPNMQTKADHQKFREEKLKEYDMKLNPDQENGMIYVEGEMGNYSKTNRVMGPLAAVAHVCDVLSARLWFNYPGYTDDPWNR